MMDEMEKITYNIQNKSNESGQSTYQTNEMQPLPQQQISNNYPPQPLPQPLPQRQISYNYLPPQSQSRQLNPALINRGSLSTEVVSPLIEIHTKLANEGSTNLSQDEFIQQIVKTMGTYGYTPGNIGSNTNDYAKKQIISSLIITALGSMGIATGPIAPFVRAAVMKPNSTAKLAVAGTLIGAPLSFTFPFVAIFSILWVFLFISLIIHWVVRSNTKSNTKIFWDPENDKDAHKNFTKFMMKSGIFLIIYYGITALYLKFAFDQSMDIFLGD